MRKYIKNWKRNEEKKLKKKLLPAFCNSCGTGPAGKSLASCGTVEGTETEVTLICG
jgi:hypothetical protein